MSLKIFVRVESASISPKTITLQRTIISKRRMIEYQSIKDDVLRKLEEHMPVIRERFGIETIGIFGSVSRGEDTKDSDIDILYKYSTPLVTLNQLMGLKEYLEDLFGREVDLVGLKWIEPSIRPYIEADMILFGMEAATA